MILTRGARLYFTTCIECTYMYTTDDGFQNIGGKYDNQGTGSVHVRVRVNGGQAVSEAKSP